MNEVILLTHLLPTLTISTSPPRGVNLSAHISYARTERLVHDYTLDRPLFLLQQPLKLIDSGMGQNRIETKERDRRMVGYRIGHKSETTQSSG